MEIKVLEKLTEEQGKIFSAFLKEHFTEIDWNDPDMPEWYWNPAQVHLMAYEGDELVGVAHITKRVTTVDNQEIVLACFGGLVVSQEHRGKGIASELIKKRFEIACDWKADVAFLNTAKRNCEFFAKFGFERMNHNYSFKGKSGKVIEDDNGMLAPLNSAEKFKLVMTSLEPLYIGEGNL